MRMKTVLFGAVAASLAATPIVAEAARTAAPVDGESGITAEGGLTQLIVLALVAAAIIGGIALSDDDNPSSP